MSSTKTNDQRSDERLEPLDLHHPDLEILLRGLLHELRNPLSSIITASTLLQDGALPGAVAIGEETQMLLGVIKKESLHLNHILLEFADYIQSPPPAPALFDLSIAAEETANEVVSMLQTLGVLPARIAIENRLQKPSLVNADESQIRNALRRLLQNAVEAMPDDGKLVISSLEGTDAAMVGVCLSDTGKGLSNEIRERAFQPFYSTKSHHIGLGLAAARSIIQAAGGRVWIGESDPGQNNTRICFELPRDS